MNVKALILLVLQIAIAGTVFSYGLQARRDDLLYVVARPGLLLRSLVAMLVVMPLLVVACVYYLELPQPTAVVLTALAISPVPPLLPKKENEAGVPRYGLGLLVVLALMSIVTVPLSVALFNWLFTLPLAVNPLSIMKIVLTMIIVPLAAGRLVARFASRETPRLLTLVRRLARLMLIVGVIALLAGTWRAIWSSTGHGTVVAIMAFVLAGLAVGHCLGAPEPRHSMVLALSTASRHPAIALAISAANYPGEQFAPTLALYLILCTILVIPYVKWQRSRSAVRSGTPSR